MQLRSPFRFRKMQKMQIHIMFSQIHSAQQMLIIYQEAKYGFVSCHGFLCVRTRDALNLFLEWGNLSQNGPTLNRKLSCGSSPIHIPCVIRHHTICEIIITQPTVITVGCVIIFMVDTI